jgi:hypothetical protein
MNDTPDTAQLPPALRFLNGLVIALMITMIVGVITVVWVLVTRMPDARNFVPILPDQLILPPGEVATAVTMGSGWSAVTTLSQKILIFNSEGVLVQTVQVAH